MRLMRVPDFTNRNPSEIMTKEVFFDSVGFVYRGLSWLDYAKRHSSVSALLYAALDIRQAIEQLFFEEIVMSVGGQLDKEEYEKCKGNATKLAKIIRRLSPAYEKLVNFTRTIISIIPNSPPLIIWDHAILLKCIGSVSTYLHWVGEPKESFESPQWFLKGLETIESVATNLWNKMTSGYSGIMMPDKMQPEIRQIWDDFCSGKIDLDGVRVRARIASPVLSARMRKSLVRTK
jgi:hypothetical protein